MKKFLFFLRYIFLVATFYFIIDFCCGVVIDKFFFLDNDLSLKYAHQGGNGEKVAILGASRAKHHYNPAVIEKEIGVSSYNYGKDGRNIFNQYIVANELLTNASIKPDLIILEIASIDIANSPGWNGEKLSNLFPLYKKNLEVREIVDREDSESGIALKFVNLYRYNSSLLDYLKNVYSSCGGGDLRGYVPLYSEWGKDAESIQGLDDFSVYPRKEVYLKKLLELAEENDIKVVVYNSPEYKIVEHPPLWESKIAAICSEYDVPFINHAHDSLFLSHKEWFNEPFHLNNNGANKYSIIIANEINEYINQ